MSPKRSAINWSEIARGIGAQDGCGSTQMARLALEQILGEDALREMVDYYISQQPASELVRHVLWLLHPWSAMQRCYEIYKGNAPLEDRMSAVELLRVVADSRALQWIAEFLGDSDPAIQGWGVGVLDQLLWSHLVEQEDCSALLEQARMHSNPSVRDKASFIDTFLKDRK